MDELLKVEKRKNKGLFKFSWKSRHIHTKFDRFLAYHGKPFGLAPVPVLDAWSATQAIFDTLINEGM